MQLVSCLALAGRSPVGVVDRAGGGVRDLDRLIGPVGDLSPMRLLLAGTASDPAAPVADAPLLAWSEIVLQPQVPAPSKIVAAPVDYRYHQTEMVQSTAIEAFGLFLKAPSSLLANGGRVRAGYTSLLDMTMRGAKAGPVPPAELTPVRAR